jgi:peptide/nickel transport system substrate-binding protein
MAAAATTARPALGPRYGGELRVTLSEAPTGVEPAVPRTPGERLLAALVHETLLGVDEEGRPRPALVQAWSAAADGREWTLRLASTSFHDGTPATAGDAVRALRRFLRSPSVAAARFARGLDGGEAFRRASTESLAGVAALDEARLTLRFTARMALPLAPLASPAAGVVSARGAGAGPFVPTTPPSARGVSATAFSGHVRGRPFLDVVRLAVAASRADEAKGDVAWGPPGLGPDSGLLLLVLDPAAPPFADARARATAAQSVDRASLARHFLPGGEPAEVLLAPPLLPPWPPSSTRPSTASTLQGRVVLRVAADVPPSASQRVVAHLSALGLDVQALPTSTTSPASSGCRLFVWYPEVAEAGLALEELSAMASASTEVRAALDAAEGERDADRRRASLQRAEDALRATHVLVPLARLPLPLSPRAGVHGLRATATGALVAEDAWTEP